MIEQRAKVIAVKPGFIRINTEPQSGCHSCGAKSGCGSALIAQMFPARFNQQLLLPSDKLVTTPGPGDHVVIGIDEGYLQKISLLLYAVPLLGLLVGAIAGQTVIGTELASIVGGLSGLSATLLSIRWGARRLLTSTDGVTRILRVEPSRTSVPLDRLDLSGSS